MGSLPFDSKISPALAPMVLSACADDFPLSLVSVSSVSFLFLVWSSTLVPWCCSLSSGAILAFLLVLVAPLGSASPDSQISPSLAPMNLSACADGSIWTLVAVSSCSTSPGASWLFSLSVGMLSFSPVALFWSSAGGTYTDWWAIESFFLFSALVS